MRSIESRTKNIVTNVASSLVAEVIILIVSFANRTLFIQLLGEEYLGIDGLFGSILTVFSLAELGIGNAIVFSLYKPIAEKNTLKATQYLTLIKKAYNIIILVIIIAGLALMPFLHFIVKADSLTVDVNLYIVYILFLLNTISTYFLAYRATVLSVNQRNSILSFYQMVVKIVSCCIEIIILFVWKNYYLFLIIKIAANYIRILMINAKAKKEYPELCKDSKEKLLPEEISLLKKNVFALFIMRIGSVVLSTVDNLVINEFISLIMVGIYSNYVLLVSSVQTISTQMFSAMTGTIGNFIASEDKNEAENVFKTYTFLVYLVFGFCSICLYLLSTRFVELLWGTEYLLSKTALLLICMNFFLFGFQTSINTFRSTTGLFVQGKYRGLVSAAVNLVVSIILVKVMGIEGVVLGTIISRVTVSSWYDPYILYKVYFKKSPFTYYMKIIMYFIICFGLAIGTDFILDCLPNTIFNFIICCGLSIVVSSLLLVPFIRQNELKYCVQKAKSILVRK